jgi:hypothetical protein
MNETKAPSKNTIKLPIIIIIYILATIFIMGTIESPGLADPRTGMIPMTEFAAYRPFMYRAFMPFVIRGIEAATPVFVANKIDIAMGRFIHGQAVVNVSLQAGKADFLTTYGYRVFIYLCLIAFFIFAFLFALRSLAKSLGDFSDYAADLLPLGMMLILSSYFNLACFVYDFPHLFFATIGLYLLFTRRWKLFIPIFSLAVLNKETAIFLTIIYVFYYFGKLPRKQFWSILTLQLIAFIVIKSALYFAFQNNPGKFIEWHLGDNLAHLLNPANYVIFKPINASLLFPNGIPLPLPRGINILSFGLMTFLIIYGWRQKSLFLRTATVILIVQLVMAIPWGLIYELRAYYDSLPIVYLLAMSGLLNLFKRSRMKTGSREINAG